MSTKDRGENQRLLTRSDIRGLPGLRGQWSDVVRRTGPYGSEYNPLIVFHTGLDENVVGKLVEHLYLLDRTNGRLIIADLDVLDYTDQSGDPASLHRQINRFYRDFKDILPRYLIAWDASITDFDPLLAKIAKRLDKRGIDPLYPLLLLPVTRKGEFDSHLYQRLIALDGFTGTVFLRGHTLCCGRFDPADPPACFSGSELAVWMG